MSYFRPSGVTVIVIFLLLNTLGYLAVGLCYLALLNNPAPLIFPNIDLSMFVSRYGATPTDQIVLMIIGAIIGKGIDFLSISWILTPQVIFNVLLIPLLIVMSLGLFRMKKWARITTIIYTILYIAFPFVLFIGTNSQYFFNLNIFVALLLVTQQGNALLWVAAIIITLVSGILILWYLFGNAKYDFQ